jgi:hypothetical protein
MNTQLTTVIQRLRPNSEFAIYNNSYDEIVWIELEGKPPTQAEINVELAKMEQEIADKGAAKEAAEAKLEALGLTKEDLQALGL